MSQTKVCTKCQVEKSLDEFYLNANMRDGRQSWCKECNRAQKKIWRASEAGKAHKRQQILKSYGLTDDQFTEMLALQDFSCAICLEEFTTTPVVDHDHTCCEGRASCGKCVRALLCSGCNKGLGSFHDDPTILRWAADYVEKHRCH